jgi:hypothetical protein
MSENEDDFICGERSLKEDIINLVQSNKRPPKKLELSHFVSANIKSVQAKIVLGDIFSHDDSYCIYFNETPIETFLSMKTHCNLKKQTGLVCSNGNSWAGWDKKEGIYLRYDDTIKNNESCMKIIEITGFEELEVQELEVTKPKEEDDLLMCEKMEKMSLGCNIDSIEFQIYSIISTEFIKKNDKYRDILSNTPEFSKSVIDRFKTQGIILSQNTTKLQPPPKTQSKLTTKTSFPNSKKTALFFLISQNPTQLESIISGKIKKMKVDKINTCIQSSKDDLVRYNTELTEFTKSCPDYIHKKTNAYIEFCKEFKSLMKDPKQMWKVVNQDMYKDLLSNNFKSFIKQYTE